MLKRLPNPFRTQNIDTTEKPRSWWGTALSLLAHGSIVAILWSAPAIELSPPEVPPPESIDATILPPPPAEKPAETPPVSHTPPAASTPTPSPTQTSQSQKLPESDIGKQTQGTGDKDSKQAESNGKSKKALAVGSPTPIAIPNGGFRVTYDLSGSMGTVSTKGKATLQFARKGDQYTAFLSASAKELGFKATIMGQASGEVRANTIATTSFIETSEIPFSDTEQTKFEVDYANAKTNFTVKGISNQTDIQTDVVFDYVSAISYLQMAFQQGKLKAGQGNITLPIGKRNEIDMANINIGNYDSASSYVTTNDNTAIPATITLNSKNLKYIKVWFVVEKNYMPLKIEIATKKIQLSLLARDIG